MSSVISPRSPVGAGCGVLSHHCCCNTAASYADSLAGSATLIRPACDRGRRGLSLLFAGVRRHSRAKVPSHGVVRHCFRTVRADAAVPHDESVCARGGHALLRWARDARGVRAGPGSMGDDVVQWPKVYSFGAGAPSGHSSQSRTDCASGHSLHPARPRSSATIACVLPVRGVCV